VILTMAKSVDACETSGTTEEEGEEKSAQVIEFEVLRYIPCIAELKLSIFALT
jgi:hypothetical protein